MAGAEVGDEQYLEDPTVNELQRRMAELLGHEAALFLPTATMANQVALRAQTKPGGDAPRRGAHARARLRVGRAGDPLRSRDAAASRARPGASRPSTSRPRTLRARSGRHRRAREHAPQLRRAHLAARRVPRRRRRRARARRRRAPRRRAALQRGGRRGNRARPSGRASPTRSRSASRRASAARSAPSSRDPPTFIERAWESKYLLRRRDAPVRRDRRRGALCARPQRRTARRGPRARAPARRRDRPRRRRSSRRTSSRSTIPETAIARLAARGVLVSDLRPGVLRAITHLDVTDDDIDQAIELIPEALGATRTAAPRARSAARRAAPGRSPRGAPR